MTGDDYDVDAITDLHEAIDRAIDCGFSEPNLEAHRSEAAFAGFLLQWLEGTALVTASQGSRYRRMLAAQRDQARKGGD